MHNHQEWEEELSTMAQDNRGQIPTIQRVFLTALAASAVFSFLTHGFLFSNEFFSHDSISYFTYSDWGMEFYAGVGRFLIPFYESCKGNVAAPWLNGCLFILWMALASCAVIRLLEIRSLCGQIFTCGLLCTNLALTLTGATYIYCMDDYALSLLLAALAAYLFCAGGSRALAGLLPLIASLAIYQPYFTVGVSLCLLAILGRTRYTGFWKCVWTGICCIVLSAAGFTVYYTLWQFICGLAGVPMRRTEDSLLTYGPDTIRELLTEANRDYFAFLMTPAGVLGIVLPLAHIILLALLVHEFLRTLTSPYMPPGNRILRVGLICLLPTAFNSAAVLIPGEAHALTAFARELLYLLPVMAMEEREPAPSVRRFTLSELMTKPTPPDVIPRPPEPVKPPASITEPVQEPPETDIPDTPPENDTPSAPETDIVTPSETKSNADIVTPPEADTPSAPENDTVTPSETKSDADTVTSPETDTVAKSDIPDTPEKSIPAPDTHTPDTSENPETLTQLETAVPDVPQTSETSQTSDTSAETEAETVSETPAQTDQTSATDTADQTSTTDTADQTSTTDTEAEKSPESDATSDKASETGTASDEASETGAQSDKTPESDATSDKASGNDTKSDEVSEADTKSDEVSEADAKLDKSSGSDAQSDKTSELDALLDLAQFMPEPAPQPELEQSMRDPHWSVLGNDDAEESETPPPTLSDWFPSAPSPSDWSTPDESSPSDWSTPDEHSPSDVSPDMSPDWSLPEPDWSLLDPGFSLSDSDSPASDPDPLSEFISPSDFDAPSNTDPLSDLDTPSDFVPPSDFDAPSNPDDPPVWEIETSDPEPQNLWPIPESETVKPNEKTPSGDNESVRHDRYRHRERKAQIHQRRRRRMIFSALLCVVLWHHVVFANQVYMKKDLEKNSTLFLAARIVDRIEQTEGYQPGVTKVAFAGRLDYNSELDASRDAFDDVSDYAGLWHSYAATYNLGRYLTDYLRYPIDWDRTAQAATWETVRNMPVFPAPGSVRMVGDTVVVKLS